MSAEDSNAVVLLDDDDNDKGDDDDDDDHGVLIYGERLGVPGGDGSRHTQVI